MGIYQLIFIKSVCIIFTTEISVRELTESDLHKGFLDLLASKHFLGTITPKNFYEIFNKIDKNPNHFLLVVEKNNVLVGMGTLLIHLKFNSSLYGTIDDVIVSQDGNTIDLELMLIEHIVNLGKEKKCTYFLLEPGNRFLPHYELLNIKKNKIQNQINHKEFY